MIDNKTRCAEYYQKHKDRWKKYNPSVNKHRKQYLKKWRQKNKYKFNLQVSRWHKENRGKRNDYYKNYYWTNKDKFKEYLIKHSDKNKIRRLTRANFQKAKKCDKCGSIDNLEFHHWDYNNASFFITLCKRCHTLIHKEQKLTKKEG